MNIDTLRADTPACERVIHFNNAGSSLMPRPVYEALTAHLALENEIGGYEAAAQQELALAGFYSNFARLLNAQPEEIAYAENATRAWDMLFYSVPLQRGDRILTHGSEYASNYLAFMHQARKRGLHIDVVPSDEYGQIDLAALRRMIKPQSRLISITHVPTQSGLINPAAAVGQIAREHGLLYLLDACQSVGQLQVDVQAIGCDMLTGTGRKFLRGPRGTGFLYVCNRILEKLDPPFIDLQAATWTASDQYELARGAMRFENWESFIAGRLGLSAAVSYALHIGMDQIENRVLSLGHSLRTRLQDMAGIEVCDRGEHLCGIVTFRSDRHSPEMIATHLAAHGINVSVSVVAYSRLDLGARDIPAVVRASVHYYNTVQEVERFCSCLANLLHET
jgi:cysteine desulfurase / selenocysteine lyase